MLALGLLPLTLPDRRNLPAAVHVLLQFDPIQTKKTSFRYATIEPHLQKSAVSLAATMVTISVEGAQQLPEKKK